MARLSFGSTAVSRDYDVVGTVERAIVDLTSSEVKSYVVHTTIPPIHDILVPVGAVGELDDELSVDLTTEQLRGMPDFIDASFGPWVTPQRPVPHKEVLVPSNKVELSAATRVQGVDGNLGTVAGVIVDEMTYELTDVVIKVDFLGKVVVIPAAWVGHFRLGRIEVSCSRDELARYAA
ncbi:MAG: hypothetical protein HY675_16470 [Chloroflexi bacterium]|nr:hypothetical protein [Chloroflexota bacterium]